MYVCMCECVYVCVCRCVCVCVCVCVRVRMWARANLSVYLHFSILQPQNGLNIDKQRNWYVVFLNLFNIE